MKQKLNIVVTGASSGIGRATVTRLIAESFHVFAGVRKDADARSLKAEFGDAVEPLMIDVTDQGSITAAAGYVNKMAGANGLAGLVNNAGAGIACPLEYLPAAELRHQFEVNVFGQLSVTQAMLPAIRQARGRIINIGSIGDRLTMPFAGALCASKYAVASLNEALRQELFPFGIHVCLIEPASIRTEAVSKLSADYQVRLAKMSPEAARRYGTQFQSFASKAISQELDGSPPSVVAEAILHALTSPNPKARYLCGKKSLLLATLAALLPGPLFDRLRRKLFGLPEQFGSMND